jgi:hypothetical protein
MASVTSPATRAFQRRRSAAHSSSRPNCGFTMVSSAIITPAGRSLPCTQNSTSSAKKRSTKDLCLAQRKGQT